MRNLKGKETDKDMLLKLEWDDKSKKGQRICKAKKKRIVYLIKQLPSSSAEQNG